MDARTSFVNYDDDQDQSVGEESTSSQSRRSLFQEEESAYRVVEKRGETVERREADEHAERMGFRLKMFVVIFLCLTAVGLGVGTYFVTKQQEVDGFSVQFSRTADDLLTASQNYHKKSVKVLVGLSTDFTSQAVFKKIEWPFMTVPHFHNKASDIRDIANHTLIVFAPYVQNMSSWGTYSQGQLEWVYEGLNFQGDSVSPSTHISPFIHTNASTASPPQSGSPPYLPSWQMSKVPRDVSIVNYDLLDNAIMDALTTQSHTLYNTTISRSVELDQVFGDAFKSDRPVPHSIIVVPITTNFSSPNDVAGFVIGALSWNVVFSEALSSATNSNLHVVLKSTCGDVHTYRVIGENATYEGPGDLHSTKFDSWRFSGQLADSFFSDNINSCRFSVCIYPTVEMQDVLLTSNPYIYSVVVACIIVGTAVFFLLYEWLVQRRQKKIMNAIRQTTAIVSSIFPANVRERLLRDEEKERTKHKERVMSSKLGLKNFLDEGAAHADDIPYQDSKPIADLFPDTTVMFADISGFTAWSSVREPSQVFILLETVFQSFDEIAKKRGVFKVETVGDSYVAVCGLPEPRNDHAVVMARFARHCLHRMRELVKKLEITLGPDTGDLACRFGLHSGPCTAGVLRGERARFQLFGDTMNTAARMESTGQRNKIQLSQETADLLIAAGKEHWLELRKDIVVAKGKGALQTYWLTLDSRGREEGVLGPHQAVGTQQTTEAPAATVNNEAALAVKRAKDVKEQRLIDWNCELLLKLLKAISAGRAESRKSKGTARQRVKVVERQLDQMASALDEVQEIIELPNYAAKKESGDADIPEDVPKQLKQYITVLAAMYRDNSFHCFEHASHVTMSVSKLLSRIIAPDLDAKGMDEDIDAALHDHTYGITSDPLTQFSVVLAALIHDVDHRGVPNFILAQEEPELAGVYKNKSIAEQNSIDLSWKTLMSPSFEALRNSIYTDEAELRRFRCLIVNSVMATDIFDKELGQLRKSRWEKAFNNEGMDEQARDRINRKATIVIEHLIQASDVSHTMQHWHIYQKWNTRLLEEMFAAFQSGRSSVDPTINWYEGELKFFDNYIIPLAKKLKDCGVFGVSSDEYLNYATENRREWEKKGQRVVESFKDTVQPKPAPLQIPEQAPVLD